MKVRAVDVNHDWTFGNGLSNYKKDSNAIKQMVVTTLKSFKYDFFLNLDHGIDWFLYLKSPSTNIESMRQDIKARLFEVEGIASIDSLLLQHDTIERSLIINVSYTDVFKKSEKLSVKNYR